MLVRLIAASARALFALSTGLTVLLVCPPSHAVKLVVGAEIELTTPEIDNGENFDQNSEKARASLPKQAQLKLVAKIREVCKDNGCKIEEVNGKWGEKDDYRVLFPDGWWFQITYDPGCVEILFKPTTVDEIEKRSNLLTQNLFIPARSIGFHTNPLKQNHYNISIKSAFGDSAEEFLRFFVDYANHADLAIGSLGNDTNNAPPLSVLGDEQRNGLQGVIEQFQAGRLKTITKVAQAIQTQVYTTTKEKSWGRFEHYQAVGLKRVASGDLDFGYDVPMEMRAVYSQADPETFVKIGRLFEARIKYLKEKRPPIYYTKTSRGQNNLNNFTDIELKSRFYMYVVESGLRFEDFQSLLKKEGAYKAPLAAFLEPELHSAETRILMLKYFWDLLPVSEYFRAKVAETINHPDAIHHPEAQRLRERIRSDLIQLEAERPSLSGRLLSGLRSLGVVREEPKKQVIEQLRILDRRVTSQFLRANSCRAHFGN